jgi:shikimate dehydrogenase
MKKELFMIFGDPVSHSKSPLMHNYSFQELGFGGCYSRYHLKDGTQLKEKILSLKIKGCNITVPHKEEAYRACDVLDNFAKSVGVVNTIIQKGGKLYGYNTDALGFLKAVEGFDAKRVLFLGAGGTAKSTAKILKESGVDITISNRSKGRLEGFAQDGFETFTYDELDSKDFDLVVNMTSAGLSDDSLPAPENLIRELFENAKGAVDVIYKETPFLRLAKEYHLPTEDGSSMLIYQGAIAFEYFTEHQFGFDEIAPLMREALNL